MRILLLLFLPILSFGQNKVSLSSNTKVYLQYLESKNAVDVDGDDAIKMLKSVIIDKTPLTVVDSCNSSEYTFELTVIKKFGDVRRAVITVKDSSTGSVLIQTKWRRGTSNIYHGMSGTRHAIARIIKQDILPRIAY